MDRSSVDPMIGKPLTSVTMRCYQVGSKHPFLIDSEILGALLTSVQWESIILVPKWFAAAVASADTFTT